MIIQWLTKKFEKQEAIDLGSNYFVTVKNSKAKEIQEVFDLMLIVSNLIGYSISYYPLNSINDKQSTLDIYIEKEMSKFNLTLLIKKNKLQNIICIYTRDKETHIMHDDILTIIKRIKIML